MIKKILSIFKDSSGSFEGQESGEEVILLLRRHPFAIFTRIGLFIIACFAPVLLGTMFMDHFAEKGLVNIFIFISSLWFLAFWLAIFHALTMYSLNVVIITNHRVIDNDQYGLFNRKVAEIHISRIQDISVHTHGMMETFMRFGDIVIQSAGVEKQFVFHQIPNPESVKDVITQMARSYQNGVRTTPQVNTESEASA